MKECFYSRMHSLPEIAIALGAS